MLVEGGGAHGATNLFCRGHYHSLQGTVEAVAAHGELQEAVDVKSPLRFFVSLEQI